MLRGLCIGIALLIGLESIAHAQAVPVNEEPTPSVQSKPTTGVVYVNERLRVLNVDGEDIRVSGGVVMLPCGAHRLSRKPVFVPCGDSVDLTESPRAREIEEEQTVPRRSARAVVIGIPILVVGAVTALGALLVAGFDNVCMGIAPDPPEGCSDADTQRHALIAGVSGVGVAAIGIALTAWGAERVKPKAPAVAWSMPFRFSF